MSIHKFGYSAESLQKDKIENLEKEFESQTKLINIKLYDMQSTINGMTDSLQNTEGALRVQEINFDDGETKVVVNAKLFLDIKKNIEDLKINLKYLEQDVKNKFLEKKEIILDAAKLVEEQQTILRNHFERNLLFRNWKNVKIKQSKILFNYYTTKDCLIHLKIKTKSLMSTYILVMNTCWKIRKRNKDIRWCVFLSDLDYSTREDIVYSLKIDEYKDIVDLKYRMKLTDTEINFILFEE